MASVRTAVVRWRWLGWVLFLGSTALAMWIAAAWAERSGIARLRDAGQQRLALYASGLNAELQKYDYLPTLLGLDPRVVALLDEGAAPARQDDVNGYLEQMNRRAGSNAIYVLDLTGRVAAASNWNEPVTFVGEDLAYRPYFQDALTKGSGRFHGIGTTSGLPGYYFSYPITKGERTVGVAVLKTKLDSLERDWQAADEIVAVADENEVIALSSLPSWKFRSLRPLSRDTLARVSVTRQYDGVTIAPLEMEALPAAAPDQARLVRLEASAGHEASLHLVQERPLPGSGWRLLLFSSLDPVAAARQLAALATAVLYAFLALLALYLRQRRRTRRELEMLVGERTRELTAANSRLVHEIGERKRTEAELVQAGKLAVLGQMAAGIAHEVNQPLAALRTLSDNARVLLQHDRLAEADHNLARIAHLVQRMGKITRALKSFARKSPAELAPVSLARALANAQFLVEPRIKEAAIDADIAAPDPDILVQAEDVRLEQVLVNLFNNAVDALAGQPRRTLWARCEDLGERVLVRVSDTGAGIAEAILPRLFEPFCTDKAPGAGLGLGLAISSGIIRDFGGRLSGHNRPEGGAEFVVELPKAPTPTAQREAPA